MVSLPKLMTSLFCALVITTAAASAQAPTPVPAAAPAEPQHPFQEVVGPGAGGTFFFQHNLQTQANELAQKYTKAEKEEVKKDLRKQLTDVLNQLFDAHVKQQQKELEDLEKQISNLKGVLKKRLDSKTAIVDRRIDTLVQEADGLGWNGPGSQPMFGGSVGYGNSSWFRPAAPPAKRGDSSGKK